MTLQLKKRLTRSQLVAGLVTLALVAAALPFAGAASTTSTGTTSVTNANPTVGTINFYTSDPAGSASSTCPAGALTSPFAFNPTADSTTTVYICTVVSDDNGWNDVCDTTDASVTDARTFDVENSGNTVIRNDVALTCATGSGTDVAVTGSTTLEYWRPKGTAGGANAYEALVSITDVGGGAGTGNSNFDWNELIALKVGGTLGFGSLALAGMSSELTETATNTGNTGFTLHVKGADLTGLTYTSQSIGVGQVKWGTSTGVLSNTLSTSYASVGALSASTDGTPSTRSAIFQVTIPTDGSSSWVPAQTYSGSITFATSASG